MLPRRFGWLNHGIAKFFANSAARDCHESRPHVAVLGAGNRQRKRNVMPFDPAVAVASQLIFAAQQPAGALVHGTTAADAIRSGFRFYRFGSAQICH
jgi:hypothetical protein